MTFEQWFQDQDFYTNMRFVHGDALFDKDGDFFRILAVQIAWEAWQSRQAEVDVLKEAIDRQGKLAIQAMKEAHAGSRLELSIAKDIQASLKPELIESERQMNAQLTDENMKLEARIDLLQKVICLHLDDRFLNVDWALGGNNANS